jgi:hypothetical protein
VIKRVDLLNGVMMAFKRVLLVNFWIECVVVLPTGSMVGCRCLFLFFTMNSFICATKKKKKNTMSYCVIHEKKWGQD